MIKINFLTVISLLLLLLINGNIQAADSDTKSNTESVAENNVISNSESDAENTKAIDDSNKTASEPEEDPEEEEEPDCD